MINSLMGRQIGTYIQKSSKSQQRQTFQGNPHITLVTPDVISAANKAGKLDSRIMMEQQEFQIRTRKQNSRGAAVRTNQNFMNRQQPQLRHLVEQGHLISESNKSAS